jgi:hypothetical protein
VFLVNYAYYATLFFIIIIIINEFSLYMEDVKQVTQSTFLWGPLVVPKGFHSF